MGKSDLTLADPDFGLPGKIDHLLGVDIFAAVVYQGRRTGVPGSPSAFETDFCSVLAGETNTHTSHFSVTSYHTTVVTTDTVLQRFWDVKEELKELPRLFSEERELVQLLRNIIFVLNAASFETVFCSVLAGGTNTHTSHFSVSHHRGYNRHCYNDSGCQRRTEGAI